MDPRPFTTPVKTAQPSLYLPLPSKNPLQNSSNIRSSSIEILSYISLHLLSSSCLFLIVVKMMRDELCIKVPSVFRCPISMDVMRSPVSLCTGITYDRSSIQHWLDSGHDTCPATMQTLPSKDFVPNLTLHRLINLWVQSHGPPSPASSQHQIRSLIDTIQNQNENLLSCLLKIVDFASVHVENQKALANFEGFFSAIVKIISKEGTEMEVLKLVIRILDLILIKNEIKEQERLPLAKCFRSCLSSFDLIFQNEDIRSKTESARVMNSLAIDTDSKRAIAEDQKLFHQLINLLTSETDQNLHDAILSCLIAISTTRSIKAQLAHSGVVQIVSKTLSNENVNVPVTEKSLRLLSMISTCAEGRSAIIEEEKCMKLVTDKIMKVSKSANEDAVAVVWSLCCFLGEKKSQEVVVKSNGLCKVLLVMQSGYCEGYPVRKMCGDLVRVLRKVVSSKSDGLSLGSGLGFGNFQTNHFLP